MIQRGRAKADQKKGGLALVTFAKAPDPPETMQPDAAAIWRATVATENLDFFASAAQKALLSDYCRHRASVEKINDVVARFQDEWLANSAGTKRFSDLLTTRDREVRAATTLATKLRLTNQSRYAKDMASRLSRTSAIEVPPWEDLG